ncbi:putative sporulation protein YtxC [Clostridium thermarum]|uniref:putative sporulation protein YtxC n=1 Tax=Clostridium thermarum TaxID=1716543 RepID=UPI0013D5D656|nr:putative sporulation protein YtxC [Clostridium thermarum]
MLLLTVVYEGERDIIGELNEIKKHFKEKNIILGISESIVNNTQFIKVFCSEEEYNEKIVSMFNFYMANILYKIAIYEFYDKEMLNFLNDTYFFLKPDELRDVEIISMKILKGEELIIDESGIYYMNRKNNIIDKIIACIEENNEININGFITFRMKELREDIEAIVDKVVERYMVDKEYSEFIKLLKYFVEIQDSKLDTVNIIIDSKGKYQIRDENGKEFLKEFLNELSTEKISENNIEDLIISGLITNAPRKINIHGAKYCTNKEVLDTINNVFTDRVTMCNECELCKSVAHNIQV